MKGEQEMREKTFVTCDDKKYFCQRICETAEE